MNRFFFDQLLYLQILSFVNSFLYYTQIKGYFYNVPFSPSITAFFIKLYASCLVINAKITQ